MVDGDGKYHEIDLLPGGSLTEVTPANKHDYMRSVIEFKLERAIHSQMKAILAGFHSIIPE